MIEDIILAVIFIVVLIAVVILAVKKPKLVPYVLLGYKVIKSLISKGISYDVLLDKNIDIIEVIVKLLEKPNEIT